jgi:hypothetical protein
MAKLFLESNTLNCRESPALLFDARQIPKPIMFHFAPFVITLPRAIAAVTPT